MKSRFGVYPYTDKEVNECFEIWFVSNKTLRFGQYMYNFFCRDTNPWPELFYETDEHRVIEMIKDHIKDNPIEE